MGHEIEALFQEIQRERAAAEEAHAALQSQTQALARANTDLQQFAYSASHDLQEPLRTISLYSQLLHRRSGMDLSADGSQIIRVICEASAHMQQLISDLLAYTRAGHVYKSVTAPADMNIVAEKVIAMLQGSITDNGCRITTGTLPCVQVHESHVQQVLQNLISNSMKYRSDERNPEIHLWAERQDAFWRISVRDNGIGIAPEYAEKVFGVFKRLHGNKYSGTGIGLAICQRIVEGYGGRIWVESEVGQGSTFQFTLPAP
jgi:light-regulated signal transduction histidine kinase (bacteriophytochrome)